LLRNAEIAAVSAVALTTRKTGCSHALPPLPVELERSRNRGLQPLSTPLGATIDTTGSVSVTGPSINTTVEAAACQLKQLLTSEVQKAFTPLVATRVTEEPICSGDELAELGYTAMVTLSLH
jgi:hypothetical protein